MRDVAFSCDDNGAKYLRVTVWSLLEHYRGQEPLRINVFEGFGGHSAESKAALQAIVGKFNESKARAEGEERSARFSTSTGNFDFFSLRYHNVEFAVAPYADVIMNRAGSRWNVFTWTPIFTPLLLGDATGNVAHFDVDMLFNDDVSKLLDLDLGENLIAAVAEYGKGDPVITEAVWGKGILPAEVERYFNTGTIVFNTAKCREERTWEKLLAWYADHYEVADRIEQDAWNALYHGRTMLLPLRWNFHDRLIKGYAKRDLHDRLWQGNPPGECLEAAFNPAILHFWGPKKPWKTCHRPFRRLYHQAMRAVGQTPPREPILAAAYDLAHAWRIRRLKHRVLACSRGRKSPLKALLVPVEWIGIGLGLCLFPPLTRNGLFRLCDCLSRVMYAFDRRGRRRSLENLRIVRGRRTDMRQVLAYDPDDAPYDPSPAEERIVRRSYRNMCRTVGYAFWSCWRARRRCGATGEMDEASRAFLAANRPAVTVSGHIGCWEILSQLAQLEGHRMVSVAKDVGTHGMTALLMFARRSIGQEIVAAEGAFKPLLQAIRDGKSLGLLVDQSVSPKHGGIWIRFFGVPMAVSAAPAFFAAKGKAPIVVAWSRPLKDGRYRCETVDTISAADARDVWATTQRCADDLAGIIRRHPSCWVLNYNFFSNAPKEEDLRTLTAREAKRP